MYFLMELVSGGELLDALDALGLLKYSQADMLHSQVRQDHSCFVGCCFTADMTIVFAISLHVIPWRLCSTLVA